jgi:hypothetical protein
MVVAPVDQEEVERVRQVQVLALMGLLTRVVVVVGLGTQQEQGVLADQA